MYLTGRNFWWLARAVPQGPRRIVEAVYDGIVELPYTRYQLQEHNLPEYYLEIKDNDYKKLLANLPTNPGEFLDDEYKKSEPALLTVDGKEYEVKVRFRGDGSGHWYWPKKSWRVEFKDPKEFQGMKEMNLIIPDERDLIIEYFNNYRARKMGLVAPDDGWAVLHVNGKKHGLYYQTEQWGPEFLERLQLSPDTNLYADKKTPQPHDPFTIYGELIDVSDKWKKIVENPRTDKYDYSDLNLLFEIMTADDNYFDKNIWNIVDKENFYQWYVHSKLISSVHQYSMLNARLYFDKEIGKFKFLPVDVGVTPEGLEYFFIGYHPLVNRLLQRDEFIVEMEKRLWQYVRDDSNLKNDLSFYDGTFEKLKVAFYQDKFDEQSSLTIDTYIKEYRDSISDSIAFIKDAFTNAEVIMAVSHNRTDAVFAMELSVKSHAPVVLEDITFDDSAEASKMAFDVYLDKNNNALFDGQDVRIGKIGSAGQPSTLNDVFYPSLVALDREEYKDKGNLGFLAEDVYDIKAVKRRYFLVGEGASPVETGAVKVILRNMITQEPVTGDEVYSTDARSFADFSAKTSSIDEVISQYGIFHKTGSRTLEVGPGTYIVNKNIIVPAGFVVNIEPGTTFLFSQGVSFVSYSSIVARGLADAPIKFLSAAGKPWGVLAIMQAHSKSIFEHVVFSDGGETQVNGAIFTGMLAVHGSDILVDNALFTKAHGDDALNVKRAAVEIKNSVFDKNDFDAIDSDFSTGLVRDNTFVENGNDGIDLSGSNLVIQNNSISASGDKCISIGEQSKHPIIFGNILNGCKTGIETKDASTPLIINNVIVFNEIGLNAYRKKELFINGGMPAVYNSIFWHNKEQVRDDKFSKTEINFSGVISTPKVPAGLFQAW